MELMLSGGRYVPALSGGLVTVSGIDEICQRIIMKLTARRGFFVLLPEYGSRLHTLHTVKPSERASVAKMFAAEALADEQGLSVENAELSELPDNGLQLTLFLQYNGEPLTIRTKI